MISVEDLGEIVIVIFSHIVQPWAVDRAHRPGTCQALLKYRVRARVEIDEYFGGLYNGV